MLAIALTFALAVAVNLIGLGCTAILPAVYMTCLLKRYGPAVRRPHLLGTTFYALVYAAPLFFILIDFLVALRSRRMSERQGRMLKAISGIVMISLALVMILKPEHLSF